ncbi:acetyltransferase [Candidatus Magnetomorum sp. HK-1]|nr:acetyltransferase [Candidatus Magnetomorum sp. HK-1]
MIVRVKIDNRMISFLNQKKILFDRQIDKLQNSWIRFKNEEEIEPYSCFCGLPKNSVISICKTGSFTYSRAHLKPDMIIGRYCSIAEDLDFFGGRHPIERISTSPFVYDHSISFLSKALKDKGVTNFKSYPRKNDGEDPIEIGNDVWIGKGVTLSNGIKIGNGVVVGAKSVVTKNIPHYAIVAGVPAKIIRYRFNGNIINRLLQIKWWDYHFADFNGIDFSKNIENCLDAIESRISNGTKKYVPETMSVSVSKDDPNYIIFK